VRARSLFRLVLGVALGLAPMLAELSPASAQQAAPRASAVKAAFLYKFAAFVEWPAGTFQRAEQPLSIGVMGDDEVAADLEQMANAKTADSRPVTVRRIVEGAPVTGVHILFVAERREAELRQALETASGPILIVTEQQGALRLGSVINFIEDAGRIRFGASIASAEARNLKLSARLLAVAQVIEGRR
jgi:hypothetical protein